MRELKKLGLVGRQPFRLDREPNPPLFEFQALLLGALNFTFFWGDRPQPRDLSRFPKRLQQTYAARLFLDDDHFGLPLGFEIFDLLDQRGKARTIAPDIQQIVTVWAFGPSGADAVGVGFITLVGGIPTLDDRLGLCRPGSYLITFDP